MARRITFSLRDADSDIERYLKSKINYSEYLRGLIRNDMTGNKGVSMETRIIELLERYTRVNVNNDINKCFIDDVLNMG